LYDARSSTELANYTQALGGRYSPRPTFAQSFVGVRGSDGTRTTIFDPTDSVAGAPHASRVCRTCPAKAAQWGSE